MNTSLRRCVPRWGVLTMRVNCPAHLSEQAQAILSSDNGVSALSVIKGASTRPVGDLIYADIPRENANHVITELRALGIDHEGTIVINDAPTWISQKAFEAEAQAPGAGSDAVVWASVIERAYADSTLTWTFISFMIFFVLGIMSVVERAIRLKFYPDPAFERSLEKSEKKPAVKRVRKTTVAAE